MNKNQLIDSYIEGDIETVDFLEQMETKLKEKKKGNKHHGMKRLTDMFKNKNRDSGEHEGDLNQTKVMNRTAIISLQDFL